MRVMMWGSVTRARVRSSTCEQIFFDCLIISPCVPYRVGEHDAWVAAGRVPRHGDGDGGAVVRGGQQQVRVGGRVRGHGAGAGRGLRRELGPGHRPGEDGEVRQWRSGETVTCSCTAARSTPPPPSSPPCSARGRDRRCRGCGQPASLNYDTFVYDLINGHWLSNR